MKKNLLLLLLIIPFYAWGKAVNVKSVSELRTLSNMTEVSYQVNSPDTVYATTDGRLCLSDGMMILTTGLQEAKPGMLLEGELCGTMGKSAEGYPQLQVNAVKSKYKLYGMEASWYVIDMEQYEKRLADNSGQNEPQEVVIPKDTISNIETMWDVKAFRQLENGVEARLKLDYDTIVFVGGGDAYLRGDAALCLHNTGLNLIPGMVLRGTVIGIKGEANGVPLLLPSPNTSDKYYIVTQTFDIKDHFFDFEDNDQQNDTGDMVTIEDVELDSLADSTGIRHLYLCKASQQIPVVDHYSLCNQPLKVPAHCESMKAIISGEKKTLQFYPVSNLSDLIVTNGLRTVIQQHSSAPLYDLQGRRINGQPAKGMYIQNGKKYVK